MDGVAKKRIFANAEKPPSSLGRIMKSLKRKFCTPTFGQEGCGKYTRAVFSVSCWKAQSPPRMDLSPSLLSAGVLAPNPPKERWVQRFMWRPFLPPTSFY